MICASLLLKMPLHKRTHEGCRGRRRDLRRTELFVPVISHSTTIACEIMYPTMFFVYSSSSSSAKGRRGAAMLGGSGTAW